MRIFIDCNNGVTVDDCASVSEQLTRMLEVDGIAYERLEVSSPGLDRLLSRPKDFVRFAGSEARIRLIAPIEGKRRIRGILRGGSAGNVLIEVDGRLLDISLADVDQARLVPQI